MTTIEINGKQVTATAGATIIEVADSLGLQIPRFCYHKKLSVAANCRMCLVDVEKAPKPLPACATPITEGMKIWTRSTKALQAQKSVMEFLLINHPLDCAICDQGGECELQDVAIGYGQNHSRFTEGKRAIKDQNLGPLIATEMTRCIQCTRCVRFGQEVAGVRELGLVGRGEALKIQTAITQNMASEVSGNIIDLCPVGALTAKPYRFTARAWELQQVQGIAPHDGVGSNLYIQKRGQKVMRVVPKENEAINEVWLSDRDRFSYEGLNHGERLIKPKIKLNGRWKSVSWQEALEQVANNLTKVRNTVGAGAIGALASSGATLEEGYLLQKIMRGLGSHNIDHRLRQTDFRAQADLPLFPHLGLSLPELETQETILLIGCNLRKEYPILALKLHKMTRAGGQVLVINPLDIEFNFPVKINKIVPKGDLVSALFSLVAGLHRLKNHEALECTAREKEMLETLWQSKNSLILVGELSTTHPDFSKILKLGKQIADLSGAKIGILSSGPNTAGAWLAGLLPHRLPGGKPSEEVGANVNDMLKTPLRTYLLFNMEPDLDCALSAYVKETFTLANDVIAMVPYESPFLRDVATVLLPLAPFTETAGTFVNIAGTWQSFNAAVEPLGESRPGWKILRVLGNLLNLPGFQYENIQDIQAEVSAILTKSETGLAWHMSGEDLESISEVKEAEDGGIIRIAPVPLYATDSIVRRANALQLMKDAGVPIVYLNPLLAERLGLKGTKIRVRGEKGSGIYHYALEEQVPEGSIVLIAANKETFQIGQPYGKVEIENA
jgi:NADH-quinone oxidoreductase subunit G